jgi:arginase
MPATKAIAVTYVPADVGSIIPGKSKAPQAFRDVGIIDKLRDAGVSSITEHYAIDEPITYAPTKFLLGGVRNEDLNVSVCQSVKESLTKSLSLSATEPPFQLVLGGECCMLPAILSAFWQQSRGQRIGLIYIDADTDLSSPIDSGTTGIFAGMNMTHLVQSAGSLESMKQFSRPNGDPVCDASNMVLFGTNMSSSGNKREHFAYLFDNNFKVVSSLSVSKEPERRATEALTYLEDQVDVIFIHLDVDSIDPQLFPLANVPNFTGIAFEQMMRALRIFLASAKVGGLAIAEVNPDHDPGLAMVERLTTEVVDKLAARPAP